MIDCVEFHTILMSIYARNIVIAYLYRFCKYFLYDRSDKSQSETEVYTFIPDMLIFISDMSDALSRPVMLEYLRDEIVLGVTTELAWWFLPEMLLTKARPPWTITSWPACWPKPNWLPRWGWRTARPLGWGWPMRPIC